MILRVTHCFLQSNLYCLVFLSFFLRSLTSVFSFFTLIFNNSYLLSLQLFFPFPSY